MSKKIYFTYEQIVERPNKRFDAPDPFQIHYHFRPARPANLCVTRNKNGSVNVSAGTIGPLTWWPYTMCLHININDSPHSYRNLYEGGECVIALPSRNIVKETWITALPLLEGINEMEVADLHESPSTAVKVPGVAECPVNFECVVEFKKDYYTHAIIFVKVLGATIDEEVLSMSREEVLRYYPTYEVDDKANRYGGSLERLGVMGEILECPTFPYAAKHCWCKDFSIWMNDLKDENYLNADEFNRIEKLKAEYNSLFAAENSNQRYVELKNYFTQLPKFILNDKWDDVHKLIKTVN